MANKPNIILILNDDMGFSDLGCYGGEVQTPNLDRLAARGLRYSQFYNTARCCPSRGSLLTGLYPHQADIGHMMGTHGLDGYLGDLSPQSVTIAEALKTVGYATFMSGKWHVTRFVDGPKHNWPCQRGFDDFYGIITGAANFFNPRTLTRNNERISAEDDEYFFTDAISDEAVRQIREHAKKEDDAPFFQYVAYTAPHWPLHAHESDSARYKGRFDAGWDELRSRRLDRLRELGALDPEWELSERDARVANWNDAPNKEWECRRMEVYAAQIDRMDQGIGRILNALDETGQRDNTWIMFLADNGGCAEELTASMAERVATGWEKIGTSTTRQGTPVSFGNSPDIWPGGEETYASYGIPWANVSNSPFRLYKHWVHEGGIATPLIVSGPDIEQEAQGQWRHQPGQLPDIMATCLEWADCPYPETRQETNVKPLEGFSLGPTLADEPSQREVLYWEHEGNRAVRRGRWKLVNIFPDAWELYDIQSDRTETQNLAAEKPELVKELSALWDVWAAKCGVLPWAELPSPAPGN